MYLLWKLEKLLKEFFDDSKSTTKTVDFSPILREGFTLSYPQGNSSFGEKETELFVPPVTLGDSSCLSVGNKIVFSDLSEDLSCVGLDQFVCGTSGSGTPIFACDNHNFVLEAWQLLKEEKPTLVHIDQHRDEASCICGKNGKIVQTRICDYIDYAIKNEWIEEKFFSIIESGDLWQLPELPKNNKIVNIDIDIFVPECTILTLEEKVDIITKSAQNASLITLATSPGFIEPKLSTEIAKLLWKYL